MITAPRRFALHVALALQIRFGRRCVAALDWMERTQGDFLVLSVLSMWLTACLLPFVVMAR